MVVDGGSTYSSARVGRPNDHGHHQQRWPPALSAALFSQRTVTRIVRGFRVFLAASLRTLTRRFFGPSPGRRGTRVSSWLGEMLEQSEVLFRPDGSDHGPLSSYCRQPDSLRRGPRLKS